MGYLIETSEWLEQIFREETSTPITGGPGGTSNRQASELANRTQKIKSVLKDNAIYIDNTEFEYNGQNIIFVDPLEMVGIANFVFWHYQYDKWWNARTDAGEEPKKVVGRGINGDWSSYEVGVAVGGILPTTLLNLVPGQNIYLGLTGNESDVDLGVYLGYYIKPGLMKLFIRDYFPPDPIASIAGTRTLGITNTSACAGNDSRLIHTGDVTSNVSGITTIENNKVTETKQILEDNTVHDFSTTKHGYVPKGIDEEKFLKDNGTWELPGIGSIQSAVYGDVITGRQDSWVVIDDLGLIEEFTIPVAGNYRIKFDTRITSSAGNVEIYIYKNYQSISGPYLNSTQYIWEYFSVDIPGWNIGDLCQLYSLTVPTGSSKSIQNFRLCVANPSVGASNLIYCNNAHVYVDPGGV